MRNLKSEALVLFRRRRFPIKRLLFLAIVTIVLLGLVQHYKLRSFKEKLQTFQQEVDKTQLLTKPSQNPNPSNTEPKDRLTLKKDLISIEKDVINAENAIYGSLVQALGGIFFFVTAYFAWRNVKTAEANLQATEEKQVTERFSKGIEHLASEKLEIRLGGIYALERIAKDSEKDYWTIIEVLSSFIREKSPAKLANQEQLELISIDIQSALKVIGRRDVRKDPEGRFIDLSRISLIRTDLKGIYLRDANLSGVDFREAYLGDANLSKVNLSGANLTSINNPSRTNLPVREVNFSEANLSDANLTEARLSRSNFNNAELHKANLTGASLSWANLVEAKLMEANLSEADLSRADLTGAYLNNANLTGTNLQGTILIGAKGLNPKQIRFAENWESAKYDESFRQSLGLSSETPN